MSERIYRLPVLLASLSLVACDGLLGPNDLDDPLGLNKLAVIELKAEEGLTQIAVNQTVRLIAEGRSANGGFVSLTSPQWSSSDGAIATVAADGTVTGKSTGEATITVSQNEKQASLKIKVQGSLHADDITRNETWRAADNPHVVTRLIWVQGSGSPKLTLEAGVRVVFASGTGLIVGSGEAGALDVKGTEEAPVIFTANTSSPKPGGYRGLVLADDSNATVEHLIVEYAGEDNGSGWEGAITINGSNAKPVFKNVIVRHSAVDGVALAQDATFGTGSSNLRVENSGRYPLYIDEPISVGSIPAGSSFEDNEFDAIYVYGGDLERTQTWANFGLPYIIDNQIWVSGTSTPTLTIAPGTELRFGANSGMFIGQGDGGVIKAIGTSEEPIVFTADAEEPQAGHWFGLVFGEDASAASRLEHTIVEYGGGEDRLGWGAANIVVLGDKGAFIKNSVVRHSASFGIVRASPNSGSFTTDFTSAALGNSFSNNADGNQSTPD